MQLINKVIKTTLALSLCFGLCACNNKEKEAEEAAKKAEENTISLIAVGDNLIHDTVYKDAEQEDGSYDFTEMYSEFKEDATNADIAFINQETVLGGTELGLYGYPVFNSPTEIAKNLEDTGFNLVNLATNHQLDRYEDGINNELDAFDETDIVYDGVYRSQEDFDTVKTFKVKGVKFAFLAYTYDTNGMIPENDYDISYFDEDQIRKDVKQAKKKNCDVIIVSAHWGDENTFAPNEFQEYYAQLFADLGVDLVIGTHPHVIQPLEWVKSSDGESKTLVAYSLGNFLGGMQYIQNAVGGELSLDFVKDDDGNISIKNIEWIPTFIHFEGDPDNFLEDRHDYKVYHVKDYTEELAEKHVYNGYEGQEVTLDEINQITEDVIDEKYLK